MEVEGKERTNNVKSGKRNEKRRTLKTRIIIKKR